MDTDAEPLPEVSRFRTAREAFEQAVLVGLTRPPCAVSFSGGRDSSAVLAVATHVARREGLPLPIPVTLRFPLCATADETGWQESVIAHLGTDEWCRVELTDEIDVLGPYAQQVLLRHGSLWPFNTHFHAPIAEQVAGGSVLTGVFGDELLSAWPNRRVAMIISRQTRPRLRDIPSVARAVAPRAIRGRLNERDFSKREPLPWLQPDARRAVARARGRARALEPIRWDESVRRYWWRSRYLQTGRDSLGHVITDADGALAVHPLCDREFLIAIAAECARLGFRNRTRAMEGLFGDLLPLPILSRTTKSLFNAAFWERHARGFVAQWDGSGVDESVVDIGVLRAMWSGEQPDSRSFILLQQAWLRQYGHSAC
ncbi:MAG TPA: asparagine synthase-related protein [Acidimicrobiales bacterium]|nr:asparagine synthase-related protein [Acidimicrobiales bacterium]